MLWRIRAAINHRLHPWLSVSTRRKLLDQTLETVRPLMTGQVLEIGAGLHKRRGHFTPPFDTTTGWLFVDLSDERKPHIQADMTTLPFENNLFDTVLCLEVLEYVEEPLRALNELHRVLKPGGVLLLSIPFLHRWDGEHDYWRLTPPGLLFALKKSGFTVESLKTQGGPLAVITHIAQHLFANYKKSRGWLLLCLISYPLFKKMLSWDATFTTRSPTYSTFSTGFFVVAKA